MSVDKTLRLRIEVEGDDEIKRKMDAASDSIDDLKTASDKVKGSITQLGDEFDKAGDAADKAAKPIENADQALENITKSAGGVSDELKNADSAFSDVAQNADSFVSSLDAVGTSFTNVATSATEADQNIKDAATGLEDVGSATGQAESGLDAVGTAFEGISASAIDADKNIQDATTGIDGLGTSTGDAKDALDGMGSAFDGAGTNTQEFKDVLSSTVDEVQGIKGGLTEANTVLASTGDAAKKAETGMRGVGSSIGIFTGFVGTAASAGIQLVSSLNSLHGAQIKVEALSNKISKATEAEGTAREKLNQLMASGSASVEDIAAAELNLQQAHDAAAIAADRLGKAQNDLNIKMAKFATDVLPSVIQTVTGTIAAVSQIGDAFPNLGEKITGIFSGIRAGVTDLPGVFSNLTNLLRPAEQGLNSITEGMNKTTEASNLLRTSIGGLTFAGFLGIAGGVATALILIATNTGGVRDTLNKYGEALGETIPALKGFLEFLGKAGEGLGQLMGIQSEADKAWTDHATKIAEANQKIADSLKTPFDAFQKFSDQMEMMASLKPLDQIFGGGGVGDVLAQLTNMSDIFDRMSESGDPLIDTLQPIITNLARMKDEMNNVGGETLTRYNQAWEFANQLMQRAMNEGIDPTTTDLLTLKNMVGGVGDAINTGFIDPLEASIKSGEKWSVTGELIKRGMEDMSGQMTTLGNLTHVTGNTFATESGHIVTFNDNLVKTKESADEAGQGLSGVKQKIEEGRAEIDGFVAGVTTQIGKSTEWATANETLKTSLGNTNEALYEHVQQTNELVGSQENAANAILKLEDSIAQHQANIDQLNTTLGTGAGQMLSYQNAIAAADEKFMQFVQTTRNAADEEAKYLLNLQGLATAFGGLPAHMEGTIEEYEAFITANQNGGDAVEAFSDMALESWRSLVSAAEPLFNDLKSAWADIFEGKTLETAQDAITAANDKIAQNIQDNQEAIVNSAEGTAPKIKDIYDGVDWGAVTEAMTDPFVEAFNKLPMAVSDTLDQTERTALTFQAKFAQTAEMAGTAWATNLQANMGEGFDQALAKANQAAADVLAPFIQQHPETAQMFQPLFDAMNQTGPGAAQAVQDALQEMSGMPGPVGDVARQMLTNYQTEFAGKIPGVTKGGAEGAMDSIKTAIDVLSMNLETMMTKLVSAINGKLDNIKQTNPTEIKVNKEALDRDMAGIQQKMNNTKQTSPADFLVNSSLAMNDLGTMQQKITDTKQITTPIIDADTSAKDTKIQPFKDLIDGITSKSVTISADATAALGAAASATASIAGVVQTSTPPINADPSGATTAANTAQTSINGVQQISTPAIDADPSFGVRAAGEVQTSITNIRQQQAPVVDVNTAGAQSKIAQLQAAISSLNASVGAGIGFGGQASYGGPTPGAFYPGMNYGGGGGQPGYPSIYGAKGFGPTVVDKPTRLLVGEAGPEYVSVIPLKGKNQWQQGYMPTKTAAAGMGYWGGPAGGGLGYDPIPRTQSFNQLAAILARQQGQNAAQMQQGASQGTEQGAQQGTQQGMNQGMGGMQDAVQQGAQQGVEQGMQGYQQAPSRIQQALLSGNMAEAMAGFGQSNRFTWTGGAMGTSLGMGGGGAGAMYPEAPSQIQQGLMAGEDPNALFRARTGFSYTWTGGAMGHRLGLPGGGGGGSSGGGMMPWPPTGGGSGTQPGGPFSQPGGGVPVRGVLGQSYGNGPGGQGYRLPGYEGTSDAEYERKLLSERDRIAAERGTSMGQGASKNFVKAFDSGVEGQSQLINGVPATILSGNGGPARQAGTQAGTAAGQGFAQGFSSQMADIQSQIAEAMNPTTMPSGGLKIGSPGYPKQYTGSQMPAGITGSQLINGVAATILPGIGPRGPRQAHSGMHETLRKDTLIQAQRNERVDISPGGQSQSGGSGLDQHATSRIIQLLERILAQGKDTVIDFQVDGSKLSRVASKHMGTVGYGDK